MEVSIMTNLNSSRRRGRERLAYDALLERFKGWSEHLFFFILLKALSAERAVLILRACLPAEQRGDLTSPLIKHALGRVACFLQIHPLERIERVLPLYNVGYIAAGTPKSLTFSQN